MLTYEQLWRLSATVAAALAARGVGRRDRVADFARRLRTTPFAVLLAAFTVVVWRWSGRTAFPLGTGVANRHRPELEELVGFRTERWAPLIPVVFSFQHAPAGRAAEGFAAVLAAACRDPGTAVAALAISRRTAAQSEPTLLDLSARPLARLAAHRTEATP